jgi:hypothetical protein
VRQYIIEVVEAEGDVLGLVDIVVDDVDDVIEPLEVMVQLVEADEVELDALEVVTAVLLDETELTEYLLLGIQALADTTLLEEPNTYATDTVSIALLLMEL